MYHPTQPGQERRFERPIGGRSKAQVSLGFSLDPFCIAEAVVQARLVAAKRATRRLIQCLELKPRDDHARTGGSGGSRVDVTEASQRFAGHGVFNLR